MPAEGMRILFLNWRDTRHPEGGGSEVYVESIAHALAAAGHDVTIFCAAHERGPSDEIIDGVRFVRAGTKLGVYPQALNRLRRRAFGDLDVIVDVQNGIPFASPLASHGVPVVLLVHHVHREQWPVIYGPVRSRIGWAIESRLSPWLYRKSHHVAVSHRTAEELRNLGVPGTIHVVHNGIEQAPGLDITRSTRPRIAVVSRLVPHKRVEHVLAAAAALRDRFPDLVVDIVGDGWWSDELRRAARDHGVTDMVTFHGFVDEKTKHEVLAASWVLALPSLKEGWGLVVMEAATHAIPTVAYRSAGGVCESILDGRTGVLVDTEPEFVAALGNLLSQQAIRTRLGNAALERTAQFSWTTTASAFGAILASAAGLTDQVPTAPISASHVEHNVSDDARPTPT